MSAHPSPEATRAAMVASLKAARAAIDSAEYEIANGGSADIVNDWCTEVSANALAAGACAEMLSRMYAAGAAPNLDLFKSTQEPLL